MKKSTDWRKNLRRWKPIYLLQIYRLSRSGLGDMKIAEGLGVTYATFRNWRKKKKSVRDALKEGRAADHEPLSTFRNFCYDRLPEHLQDAWDEIMECESSNSSVTKLEAMLKDHGRRGRQHLLLHALVHYNFNISAACRAVNISRKRFDKWAITDPDFADLVAEMKVHKKDFFEGALIQLVRQGDSAAIRMVNSTYNADRGYGRNTTINKNVRVDGHIVNEHTQIPIEELGLSIDERKRLLEALREKRQKEKEDDFEANLDIDNLPKRRRQA